MKNDNEKFYRVNSQIRLSPVMLIDQHGKNLGSLPLQKAMDLASSSDLDLVEISPNSRPPVCRLMDFGKFKFEQNLKEKKQKKQQLKKTQVKEIRLSPSIQEHDVETKVKSAIKFLTSEQKVNLRLEFKRREIAHQQIGMQVIKSFIEKISEYGTPATEPKFEGRNLMCVIEPKGIAKC